MPHKLFRTARQTTKRRNAFANNISTDIKVSKAQLSLMIQSGGLVRNILGSLGKKVMAGHLFYFYSHFLFYIHSNKLIFQILC